MNLVEVKQSLEQVEKLYFQLPNGQTVPSHFHVTEVGSQTRNFIDCGGVQRQETKINFQLWVADDVDHSLQVDKLKKIISLSEQQLHLQNAEITVEYQGENTIELYGLEFQNGRFVLQPLETACLALDACGVPAEKPRVKLSELSAPSCAPGSGCC